MAEKTMKFNVGDKVRYTDVQWFKRGEILYVLGRDDRDDCSPYLLGAELGMTTADIDALWVGEDEIELVEASEPTVSVADELATLKRRVAELEAKVAELEAPKPYLIGVDFAKESAPNELRKQAIDEAKHFVRNTKMKAVSDRVNLEGNSVFQIGKTSSEFVVNEEKRTVVALVKSTRDSAFLKRGIAKCDPSDVFNADLGKAIALGRAYGLDVSRFEQAPQPDEVVAGMEVEVEGMAYPYVTTASYAENKRHNVDILNSIPGRLRRIIADTGAQY